MKWKICEPADLVSYDFPSFCSVNTGLNKTSPVLNCKDLKQKAPTRASGVYWIDPDGGSHGNAFQAYCDQQTDVPLSETQYEAMDGNLWRTIGDEFLIKSNINNWIACKFEDTRGIVRQISCKLVKQVSKQCAGVPNSLKIGHPYGPSLSGSTGVYYLFDGYTGEDWPVHDPCGKGQPNQLKGVANPHGNVFKR
ncbi:hypothetical protein OS493_030836 [Desmophyllum pertusum]|uniref:Fibrillar collagen NC1 domain-containing protein n=1 Tax=Desmophyllum pertusum TaxID=174260 RepID=A0A9X0CI21_9CNID|nr:hypothetical protein OS493_030836 [Desmophyllum pertusum]